MNRRVIIGSLLIVGFFWAIAVLSPITSARHLSHFEKMRGFSQASMIPLTDLPFQIFRGPAATRPMLDVEYTSARKIDLNKFFGFNLKTLAERKSFHLMLDDRDFAVKMKSVEKQGDDYFTWVGTLDGNDNHLIAITYSRGYAAANINGPGGVYAIQYEHGRHMLKKFDHPE